MRILLIALLISPSTFAASAVPLKKSALLANLHRACEGGANSDSTAKPGSCDCLKSNYEKRFNESELDLLAKAQNNTLSKEALAEEAASAVIDFDFMAAEKCGESTEWKWVPAKAEVAADLNSHGIMNPPTAPAKQKKPGKPLK